ncbi:hypothetical protein MOX01_22100 [Microbacterium oxydans]|nr:hypothetical protein MOX01_22100 [Microbacterium oxydans]
MRAALTINKEIVAAVNDGDISIEVNSPDLSFENRIAGALASSVGLGGGHNGEPDRPTYRSLLFEAIRARQIVSLDQIDEVIDAVLSVDTEDIFPNPAALRYDRTFAADGRVIE